MKTWSPFKHPLWFIRWASFFAFLPNKWFKGVFPTKEKNVSRSPTVPLCNPPFSNVWDCNEYCSWYNKCVPSIAEATREVYSTLHSWPPNALTGGYYQHPLLLETTWRHGAGVIQSLCKAGFTQCIFPSDTSLDFRHILSSFSDADFTTF